MNTMNFNIIEAIRFADTCHKGQFRRISNEEYVNHPLMVMGLLIKYKSKSKHLDKLCQAALTHDTIEDCSVTVDELEQRFGKMVASLVEELTNDEGLVKKLGKQAYMKQKLLKLTSYALTLKLVDRLANVMDNPRERYVHQTIELMDYLRMNRNVSTTQLAIIDDILAECANFLLMENK